MLWLPGAGTRHGGWRQPIKAPQVLFAAGGAGSWSSRLLVPLLGDSPASSLVPDLSLLVLNKN